MKTNSRKQKAESRKDVVPYCLLLTAYCQQGFTLIETLVALSIISLAVIGPLSLAATALSAASVARDQLTAYYLAQEGIEIVRNVRDSNRLAAATWTKNWFDACNSSSNQCAVRVDGSQAVNMSSMVNRIPPISCTWQTIDTAISNCIANDTPLLYDATPSGALGSERGLFGYTSRYVTETDFRRAVIMEKDATDSDTIRLTSIVTWPTSFGRTRNVRLTEYLRHLQ